MVRVEWRVDASDAQNVRKLRCAFTEYLADRASADSDLAVAELVVTELVGNVHRHAPGPATVRLNWDDDPPILTVADTGPGFVAEIAQPDLLREDGRGLYIVAQLVGEVTVRSSPDSGAEVSVRLPVHRRPTTESVPTPGRPPSLSSSTTTRRS
jgi:signal transduction histidine kinase